MHARKLPRRAEFHALIDSNILSAARFIYDITHHLHFIQRILVSLLQEHGYLRGIHLKVIDFEIYQVISYK